MYSYSIDPEPVLSVRDLNVEFRSERGTVRAAAGVSFDVLPDEVLGIVGESGCGKTVTATSILRLLPSNAQVSGDISFRGRSLMALGEREMRKLRGSRIAMVFQDAMAALNPLHRVGDQVAEAIEVHHPQMERREVRERVFELLDLVGIPNPRARARQYPHEFSGGMRQRVMIAIAIANDPDVLIADEPTTALDVTTQAQVLEVLSRVRERTRSAMVLITHDLGVVSGAVDRLLVMYAGKVVESGPVDEVFHAPRHPYTLGLLESLPRIDRLSRQLLRIEGQPPSLRHIPPGCSFHPRCRFARLPEPCASVVPELESEAAAQHAAACHFSDDVHAAGLAERTVR